MFCLLQREMVGRHPQFPLLESSWDGKHRARAIAEERWDALGELVKCKSNLPRRDLSLTLE
jgi:hypothetical protein